MSEFDRDNRSRASVDFILAALIARGETVEEAAKFAGVTKRTVYRRLATPEFKVLMAEFRQVTVAAVMGRFLDALPDAMETLRMLLRDADPNIQFKASVKLIEFALRAHDISEQERRLKTPDVLVSDSNESCQQIGGAPALSQSQDQ